MADNDLLNTMDARVWAAEFMRITEGVADESIMLGWFASALMCGWDHHYWQTDQYKQKMAKLIDPPAERLGGNSND